jgi:hypothetical protein
MFVESIKIEIEGDEIADVYDDITTVEVELDDELPAMFRLRLSLMLREDGTWTYVDDERFRIWNRVVISAGLDGELEKLITGHVTHLKPAFHVDPTQCVLDV